MIDKHIRAFDLPRITITNKWDWEFKEALKDFEDCQVFFGTGQKRNGDLKVIDFGRNEELYALLQTTLHRHIEVHDFFKIAMINIEMFRNGEMNEAFELMTRAVEYINIKNSKILKL